MKRNKTRPSGSSNMAAESVAKAGSGGQGRLVANEMGVGARFAWNRDGLFGLLLVLATLIAYQPAWFGQPIWDDDAHLTRPDLRSLAGLARMWVEPGATQQYYPLTFSAFWVQHQLWGDSTLGYHLVNILLHCLCALLFLKILRLLKVPGAYLAASIFALHPVHVESVAWITELKNTLSGAFYLGSVLAYLDFDRSRKKGPYALALGLFALGLLTKTAIATLPAGMLVVFWWQRGRLFWKKDVVPLVPLFLAALAAGAVTAWLEQKIFGATGEEFQLSVLERCLVAGRSIWFHLGKLFWPADLAFMYPRWPIRQTVWWQYLYPAAVLLLLGGLWAWRRQSRAPLAALLFFMGTLFPALGFFNAYSFCYSFVNDHHQYLASLGIIAAASAAAALLLGRWAWWAKAPGNWLRLALLAILAGLTWRRAGVFRDDESLWGDTLAKNPGCWMAHNNWGIDLAAQGRLDEAAAHYRAALEANPRLAEAMLGLGAVLDTQGRTDEALRQYFAAVEAKPDFAEAHNNLSSIYVKRDDAQLALRHASEAVRLRPNYAEAHYNLGNALNLQGKLAEAAVEYATAVRLKAGYAEAHYNLGGALLRLEHLKEAAAHFSEALRLQPANAAAHSKLAFILERQGKTAEAILEYQAALRLRPDLIEALRNLAWIRATHRDAQVRDGAEAVRLAEQAVRLTREQDARALDALAAAYAEAGRFTEAAASARRAQAAAAAQGQPELAEQIGQRLALYDAGQPYRQAPGAR